MLSEEVMMSAGASMLELFCIACVSLFLETKPF
jgi:hypothetical protein